MSEHRDSILENDQDQFILFGANSLLDISEEEVEGLKLYLRGDFPDQKLSLSQFGLLYASSLKYSDDIKEVFPFNSRNFYPFSKYLHDQALGEVDFEVLIKDHCAEALDVNPSLVKFAYYHPDGDYNGNEIDRNGRQGEKVQPYYYWICVSNESGFQRVDGIYKGDIPVATYNGTPLINYDLEKVAGKPLEELNYWLNVDIPGYKKADILDTLDIRSGLEDWEVEVLADQDGIANDVMSGSNYGVNDGDWDEEGNSVEAERDVVFNVKEVMDDIDKKLRGREQLSVLELVLLFGDDPEVDHLFHEGLRKRYVEEIYDSCESVFAKSLNLKLDEIAVGFESAGPGTKLVLVPDYYEDGVVPSYRIFPVI